VNWYRLEIVRDTLRLDYGAALAPSGVGRSNLEVWQRTVAGHLLVAFVRYEGQEFLVNEEVLLSAADAMRVSPPGELLDGSRPAAGFGPARVRRDGRA
jgi:hypothetical protein